MTIYLRKYPQATPPGSPEQLSEQCDHWRRRTYWLTAVAVTIMAASATAVVCAINEARAARALIARTAPPAIDAEPQLLPVAAPAVAGVPVAPPEKLAGMKLPPPKLNASQKERFLEALGALSSAHLFQSYLNIGLLADGVESEAYTTKQAEETMRSIENMMDQVDAQLGKLTKTTLEPDDHAALEQIKAVAVMLRLQAKFLQDYWKSGDQADAERYHEVRNAAWKALGKIMQP
jgi:hypothetical protein